MMIRCKLTWAISNEDIKVSNWHWIGAKASNKKFLEMCTTQMVNIHWNWHGRFTSPLTRDWTYILFHSSLGCFRSRNVCSEEIWKSKTNTSVCFLWSSTPWCKRTKLPGCWSPCLVFPQHFLFADSLSHSCSTILQKLKDDSLDFNKNPKQKPVCSNVTMNQPEDWVTHHSPAQYTAQKQSKNTSLDQWIRNRQPGYLIYFKSSNCRKHANISYRPHFSESGAAIKLPARDSYATNRVFVGKLLRTDSPLSIPAYRIQGC